MASLQRTVALMHSKGCHVPCRHRSRRGRRRSCGGQPDQPDQGRIKAGVPPHTELSLRCLDVERQTSERESILAGTAAGVAAGVPVVGILTSQTKERMEKAGVSLTIKDYTELVARAKADKAKHTNYKT